jgi:Ni,Fe-hydrogenase maturation factor
MSNKTLVLGIGNPLMQDDGIGVHVAMAHSFAEKYQC